ncbi:MAG: HEAT repeat domain-containing protein [Bacillota bacterium]
MNRLTKNIAVLALACGSITLPGCSDKEATNKPESTKPVAVAAAKETLPTTPIDDALAQLRKYEFGQSRTCLTAVGDYAVAVAQDPAKRRVIALKLADALGPDTTKDCKTFVCRQMVIVGTAETVPALAKLLPDDELSDFARYALERMEYPAAGAALRESLSTLKGNPLIGVINSIGERRDTKAIDALVPMLANSDLAIATSSATALAKIGTPKAANALAKARANAPAAIKPALTDAYLLCAERLAANNQAKQAAEVYEHLNSPAEAKLTRIAALRGLVAVRGIQATNAVIDVLKSNDPQLQIAAAQCLADIPGDSAVKAVAAVLPKLSPAAQAVVIEMAANKGGTAAQTMAMDAVKSPDPAVRLAAIRALGRTGQANTLSVLLPLAASTTGAEQQAARNSLDQLKGADVDDAMVGALTSANAKERVELIRSLGARNATKALPTVLKSAEDTETSVRVESFKSLSILASNNEIPALLNLLSHVKTPSERTAAEETIVSVCRKIAGGTDKDASAAPVLFLSATSSDIPAKCSYLRILSRIGGPKAMAALRSALKDNNPDVSEVALRALAEAGDMSAAPDLLDLAKNAEKPNHKVLALRGYLRLAGQKDLKSLNRLNMYTQALPLATRAEEKRAVLSGVADLRTLAALDFILPCLENESIREEAAQAAVAIATNITKGAPSDKVKAAMETVLKLSKDAKVRQSAQSVLAGNAGKR